MQGKGIGNLSLERKLLIVFTPHAPSRGRRKRKRFVFTPTVPLKGEEEKEGFPQGFVEWRSIFLLVCLVMLRGKPLIVCLIGRLQQAGVLTHTAERRHWLYSPRLLLFKCRECKPLKGHKGFGTGLQGVCQGFEAVVVEGFVGFAEGCEQGFVYWFAGRVQRFSFFWQTMGHTLFIFIHIFLKSNFVIL